MNQQSKGVDRDTLIDTKAKQLAAEGRHGITYDEASEIGMHPTVLGDGAWGVTAEFVFQLGTAIETHEVISEAQERELGAMVAEDAANRRAEWDALDRTHVPSGRGLRRINPTGEVPIGQVNIERGF